MAQTSGIAHACINVSGIETSKKWYQEVLGTMAKFYFEKDTNLDYIKQKKFAVIGYGHQGRSQALNLRDNGFGVVIGNIEDEYL